MCMKKKYAMSLLEVMVVIFIIGIIGSVVGYNMRGSLDHGKAFKTKESARKLYEIVVFESLSNNSIPPDTPNPIPKDMVRDVLSKSDLVRRPKDLIKDGWGEPFVFYIDDKTKELRCSSEKYELYCTQKGIETEYPWEKDDVDTSQ